MSVIKPEIDTLLEKTEHNPFLLCAVASSRACDINNMVRGQHLRVIERQSLDDITPVISGKDPVSIAMTEIADNTLSFVQEDFDAEISGANANVARNEMLQ